MILYKKEPIKLLMSNIMLLDDPSTGGVIYVSKATYDECVLLHNRFYGEPNELYAAIKTGTPPDDAQLRLKATRLFKENAPSPVNMLAPFIMRMDSLTEEYLEDITMENLYGLLHITSQVTNFNLLLDVHEDVRATMSLPLAVLRTYKDSWDNLTSTLIDFVVAVESNEEEVPTRKKNKKIKKIVPVVEEDDEEEEEDEEDDEGEEGVDHEKGSMPEDFIANLFKKAEAETKAAKSKEPVVEPVEPIARTPQKPKPMSLMSASSSSNKETERAEINNLLNDFSSMN